MTVSVTERLRGFHRELSAIEPRWVNWERVVEWAGRIRPFLAEHFPEVIPDLARHSERPNVPLVVFVGTPGQPHEYDAHVQYRKRELLALLDSLLQRTEARDAEAAPEPVVGMPFRPYRRPKVQFLGVGEYSRQLQRAALDGHADEEELRANGGREGVVASIRRHLPSFDPADAQTPYAPAWVALKPILVRAGLNIDEETTLTDIKGFLDTAAPPSQARNRDGDWYDTMQVCDKGHQITSMAEAYPSYRRKRCPECGSATLMACPRCSAPIPGYLHTAGFAFVASEPDPVPTHCDNCDEPFPWTREAEAQKGVNMASSNKVFVVHGHDEEMKQAAARTLTTLGLDPVILHEQPNQGRTIIEKFEDSSDVGFAVVLLSPDDMAYSAGVEYKKAKPRPRARQNVVAEMFYFMGKLGRHRIFALCKQAEGFELPSDYQGVVYTPYDAAGKWRFDLAQELKAAKYDVDANKLLRV